MFERRTRTTTVHRIDHLSGDLIDVQGEETVQITETYLCLRGHELELWRSVSDA